MRTAVPFYRENHLKKEIVLTFQCGLCGVYDIHTYIQSDGNVNHSTSASLSADFHAAKIVPDFIVSKTVLNE